MSDSDQSIPAVLMDTYLNLAQRLRQFGRLDAGRLFGTVPNTHGGYIAWMDMYERAMYTRCEVNALVKLLTDKGIITKQEWLAQLTDEMAWMFEQLAKHWPELEIAPDGKSIVIKHPQPYSERAMRERWPP